MEGKIIDYLYELENTIYRPTKDWTEKNSGNVTNNMRVILIDWLYDVTKSFKVGVVNLILSVSILDAYMSLIKPDKEQLQKIGCMALHLAGSLRDDGGGISDYVYITDGSVRRDEFIPAKNDILSKLDGRIIRPIPSYFMGLGLNMRIMPHLGEKFVIQHSYHQFALLYISLFASSLMVYKPSVIADAINFMLTGKVLKYPIDAKRMNLVQQICPIIMDTIKRGKKSSLKSLNEHCSAVESHLKTECPEIYENIKNTPLPIPKEMMQFQKPKELGKLGEGVQGEVFKIKHGDRFYAQKSGGEEYTEELAILKLFRDHKHIVKLEGFLPNEDRCFLFFELGTTNLRSFVDKAASITLDTMMQFFTDILMGLKVCHHYDVIHGDLKPDNVVWYENSTNAGGTLKLIDFGLAQCLTTFQPQLRPVVVTPTYRAPEVFFTFGHYDHKIDVWSAGCVLFFIATGREFLRECIKSKCNFKIKNLLRELFSRVGTPSKELVITFREWEPKYDTPHHKYDTAWFKQEIPNKGINDILKQCFTLDPKDRPSADQLLQCLGSR